MDPEAQFYPVIHTNYMTDNQNNKNISHFINYSFHGESSTPTPFSSVWDV